MKHKTELAIKIALENLNEELAEAKQHIDDIKQTRTSLFQRQNEVLFEQALNVASEVWTCRKTEIMSASRFQDIAEARFTIMEYLFSCGLTADTISHLVCRKLTSVHFGLRRHRELIQTFPPYQTRNAKFAALIAQL